MKDLTQSQTAEPLTFCMIDSSDHISPKTGLTCTVTLSKNGGSFASPSGAVTEIGSGWYKVAGNATDTNTLGQLILHATSTGADPTDERYQIVSFNTQDATRMGLTALPNANAAASGGLVILGANTGTATLSGAWNIQGLNQAGTGAGQLDFTSGVIKANATQWAGTSITASSIPVTVAAGAAGGLFIAGSNAATTVATFTSTGAFSISGVSMAAQTGDTFARVGIAGVGLTNLGDSRIANLDATTSSRLAPTTPGRTLDVSAGGEAGLDWANIGSPTTSQSLTGTTVKSDQTFTGFNTLFGNVNGGVAGTMNADLTANSITNVNNGASANTFYQGIFTVGAQSLLYWQGVTEGTTPTFTTASLIGVWAVANRTLSSFGTLVADIATAVWTMATSALTVAGSIGKWLLDHAGLSQQDVRDAMTLDPTDGLTPGTASIDTQISEIDGGGGGASVSDIWTYGNRSLTGVIQSIATRQSGLMIIAQGTSNLLVNGTSFTVAKAVNANNWPTDLTDFTLTLALGPNPKAALQVPVVASLGAVTILVATGTSQAVNIDVTDVQSAVLVPGVNVYTYEVWATKIGESYLLEHGFMTVIDDVRS